MSGDVYNKASWRLNGRCAAQISDRINTFLNRDFWNQVNEQREQPKSPDSSQASLLNLLQHVFLCNTANYYCDCIWTYKMTGKQRSRTTRKQFPTKRIQHPRYKKLWSSNKNIGTIPQTHIWKEKGQGINAYEVAVLTVLKHIQTRNLIFWNIINSPD